MLSIEKDKCHLLQMPLCQVLLELICASYVVNDVLKDIPVRRIKDKGQ